MDGSNDKQDIAAYLSGDRFARWWDETPALASVKARQRYGKSQAADVPVAVFGAALRRRGAPPKLRISRDTVSHIKFRRPWVTAEQMLLSQKAVDGGHAFERKKHRWIGYAQDDAGQWWMVPWKVTDGGTRAYQTTLIDVSRRTVEREIRKMKRRLPGRSPRVERNDQINRK